jgi:hypothetical protein
MYFLRKLLTSPIQNIGVSIALGKTLGKISKIGEVISEEEFSVMLCGFDELKCDNKCQFIIPILINQVVYAIYLAFQIGITIKSKKYHSSCTINGHSKIILNNQILYICSLF